MEFKNLGDKKVIGNNLKYVSKSSTEKKIVPNFLIEKNESLENLVTLLDGLKILGDFLDKTILKPNNLTQPISRIHFINSLK